jgi:hypothetical protein
MTIACGMLEEEGHRVHCFFIVNVMKRERAPKKRQLNENLVWGRDGGRQQENIVT